MTELHDRYYGTLVGVLAGDALGAPYETWRASDIQADIARRGGLVPFDYDDPWKKDGRFPAGRPTDDSEMTAALGINLCVAGDDEDLYRRFRQCAIEKQSFLCGMPAYGFGGTTRRALAAPTYKEAQAMPQAKPPIPSNGSLMRAAPVALRHHGSLLGLVVTARQQSVITHTHPLAIECTVFYTVVLDRVLAGCSIEQAVSEARRLIGDQLHEQSLIDYIECALFDKPNEPDRSYSGGALFTLQVALWAAAHARSFRNGIFKAICIGGDTDTYGAVAGGLLGALYGSESMPPEWCAAMSRRGYEVMLHIAHVLWRIRGNELAA